MSGSISWIVLAAALASGPPGARGGEDDFVRDELVGPFPGWRDLRRDYGATGDGRADDSPALQRALDELTHHEASCVLWVPAGT